MKIKSQIGVLREWVLDSVLYANTLLRKKTYADFYGKRMDRRLKRNRNWGLNLNKKFQLEYLVEKGLSPHHKFLDFGCGAISAGRYFIGYLDCENYCGLDVSEAVVSEANKRVEELKLTDKKPLIMHIPSGDIDLCPIKKFDFILAQSVFTHMPIEEILTLLKKIRKFMNKDSKFFFTFVPPDKIDRAHERIKLKDWAHSEEAMRTVCKSVGFEFAILSDWVHPDAPGKDRLGVVNLP